MPVDLDIVGKNAETFPVLRVWGWEIAAYLFLGGLAAGLLVLSGAAHRRSEGASLGAARGWMGPLLAPAALAVGMLALFLDLENKWNVWRFYSSFQIASPMSWGSWILLLVFPAALAFAWAGWTQFGPQGARWVTRRAFPFRRAIAGANLVLGVALGIYTGILLGSLGARPLWNSPLLGPLFLVSGLSSAAALLLLLEKDERARRRMAHLDAWLIGGEAIVLALLFLGMATGGAAQRESARLFFGGSFTAIFWISVVFMGMVLPLWLERRQQAGRAQPTPVPQLLVLLGGAALRAVIVFAGQASSWEVLV